MRCRILHKLTWLNLRKMSFSVRLHCQEPAEDLFCILLQTRWAFSSYLMPHPHRGHYCTFSLYIQVSAEKAEQFPGRPHPGADFPNGEGKEGQKGSLFGELAKAVQNLGITALRIPYCCHLAIWGVSLQHPARPAAPGRPGQTSHSHSRLHCRLWAVEAALAMSSHRSCSKACTRT